MSHFEGDPHGGGKPSVEEKAEEEQEEEEKEEDQTIADLGAEMNAMGIDKEYTKYAELALLESLVINKGDAYSWENISHIMKNYKERSLEMGYYNQEGEGLMGLSASNLQSKAKKMGWVKARKDTRNDTAEYGELIGECLMCGMNIREEYHSWLVREGFLCRPCSKDDDFVNLFEEYKDEYEEEEEEEEEEES